MLQQASKQVKVGHRDSEAGTGASFSPPQLVLDGRMLQPVGVQADVGRNGKPAILDEQNNQKPCGVLRTKSCRKVVQEDRPVLTPPQVNGVSLAPVIDVECLDLLGGKGTQQKKDKCKGPLATTHVASKPRDENLATSPSKIGKPENIYAEGHSVNRRPKDPFLVIFEEINEADSLCATPSISYDSLTRKGAQHSGPLGPLSPTSLSDSLVNMGPLWDNLNEIQGFTTHSINGSSTASSTATDTPVATPASSATDDTQERRHAKPHNL